MERMAVVLAAEPRLFRDALQESLEREPALAVFAASPDPLEVLGAVAQRQASVVVVSSLASSGVPGLATHLFAEFPELVVIGICPDSGRVHVHRQIITTETLAASSVERVVEAIRGEGARAAAPGEKVWRQAELQ
jgi:DNA-binding NarL/FixJ family response regulator